MTTNTDEKDRVRSAIDAVDPEKMASARDTFSELLE